MDISGFTRVSGQYCAKGKDGIDDLQTATNGYMGQLVNIIYDHEGDIIKFAGDAIICLFTEKKYSNTPLSPSASRNDIFVEDNIHNQSESCLMAIKCAMALRNVETEELTVHVAISCGEICFGILGGHENSWDYLVSGDCLFQLSQCLDDAPSKQVVMTPTCIELLNNVHYSQLVVLMLPSGNYLVEDIILPELQQDEAPLKSPTNSMKGGSSTPSPTRKRQSTAKYADVLPLVELFIPSYVLLSLRKNDFSYLAELREVTTIFMKWEGYSTTVHKDLLDLQPYYSSAQEILFRYGAFIRQFLVDDKGKSVHFSV